jgi:hypothetical protein
MNKTTRNFHSGTSVPASTSTIAFSNRPGLQSNWETGRDKPTGNTKGVKKMRKLTGNKKGIDTILAALLMVVIVVVASVMVYAWSTGLLGTLLVTPQTGKEAINMETYGWNPNGANTYNVTLNLRNTGSSAITLSSYYVKDSSGNQYARLNWQTDAGANHPAAFSPNALGIVTITIGSGASGPGGQCGASCSLTGSAFSFTSGYSYTITVVTSRNNQFTFTVTR